MVISMEQKVYSFYDKTSVIFGAISAGMAAVFGKLWFLFAIFFFEMIVDYVTGWLLHKFFIQDENSTKGAQGIIRKVAYIVVIVCGFLSGFVLNTFMKFFGFDISWIVSIGWIVLGAFMINEFRSILENCKLMGVPIPEILIYGFDVASKKINSVCDGIMKKEGGENEDKTDASR